MNEKRFRSNQLGIKIDKKYWKDIFEQFMNNLGYSRVKLSQNIGISYVTLTKIMYDPNHTKIYSGTLAKMRKFVEKHQYSIPKDVQ